MSVSRKIPSGVPVVLTPSARGTIYRVPILRSNGGRERRPSAQTPPSPLDEKPDEAPDEVAAFATRGQEAAVLGERQVVRATIP
jgi:hypothetical protein